MVDSEADVVAGMTALFQQISIAGQAGAFYLVLFAVFVIPDLCESLESPSGETNAQLYAAWFDKYVAPRYNVQGRVGFTGRDCWLLRCSLLHQGTTEKQRVEARYHRYVFTPGSGVHATFVGRFKVGNMPETSFVQFSIPEFCSDMVEGAMDWLKSASKNPNVQARFSRYVRYYPGGFGTMPGGGILIAGPLVT